MELLGPKCWSILISHRKLTIEEIGDQSQLFGVSVCLRSRGNGSRIRISRRRPIFTVESEPSSIARKTSAGLRPVMSQYLRTEYVTRVNG